MPSKQKTGRSHGKIHKASGKPEVVSDLRTADEILALAVSDIHLSLKPPPWRAAEPDWLAAQARPLRALREIQNVIHLRQKCLPPILYAGDIFDTWNPSPELINFAIDVLPKGYAVPGQHDLPHHNYDDIKRTAFWTLVCAEKLMLLEDDEPQTPDTVCASTNVVMHGFGWGQEVHPFNRKKYGNGMYADPAFVHVAVIHAMIWETSPFSSASDRQHWREWLGKIKGYDAACWGDNHSGFYLNSKERGKGPSAHIWNGGCFIRRKSDEKNNQPTIGMLTRKGWQPYPLDIAADKYVDGAVDEVAGLLDGEIDIHAFTTELQKLGEQGLDFVHAVKRFIKSNDLPYKVRRAVLNLLEQSRERDK